MKITNRVIIFLLVFLLLRSTMALAADKEEEFNQELYEETIRINREMGLDHISTDVIEVQLKSNVTTTSDYEKLFSGIETAKIKQIAPSAYEQGTLERQILLVYFADKTENDIWEIVETLKQNPNVYYVAPSFISPNAGIAVSASGDVNGDGSIGNADLIIIARYVVRLVDFSDEQLNAADINEDGKVDNADIIQLARVLVSIKYDDTPTLSEERKAEILQEFIQGMKRNEYDTFDYTKHVEIRRYLGQFSGCDVVTVGYTGPQAAVIQNMEIAGYYFEYSPVSGPYVFKDGEHLFLDKAYEAEWITAEDVGTIWLMGRQMRTGIFGKMVDGVFITKEVVFRSF